MRRADREVAKPVEITEMMTRCEVLHLALNTDTVPYILPVNFGMEPDGMTLYIHGAREGTKYALIEKDNRASFELDCTHGLVLENGTCSINYESVIGWGYLEDVTEPEEKCRALDLIMKQYRGEPPRGIIGHQPYPDGRRFPSRRSFRPEGRCRCRW